MSNSMFSAEELSDDDLFQRMTKMRMMLGSQSCQNHVGIGESIGVNLAILEEEYESRMRKRQAESLIKKTKKGEKPIEVSPHITLGEITQSDDPYSDV